MKITPEMLDRFFEQETTAEETDAIHAWVEESQDNEKQFQKACELHLATKLELIRQKANPELKAIEARHRKNTLRRSFIYVGAVAASLAVGVWLGVTAFKLTPVPQEYMSMSIPLGQQLNMSLPDGTVVTLNSGSTFSYPTHFGEAERRVSIEGEAMFDVAPDKDKPFIVETYAYDLKVVGTRFDVIASSEDNEFCTALLEGSVVLLGSDGSEVMKMEAGQKARQIEGHLHLGSIEDPEHDYLWTNGIISCSDVPLSSLIERIARSTGVKIVIDSDIPEDVISYSRMKVRLSWGINEILRQVCSAAGASYSHDEITNTYHITK